jgi:hypothetical protein
VKFEREGQYELVCCEKCGNTYVHMRAVRVNELGRVTAITPAAIEQYNTHKESRARGSIVEIDFWCEMCGSQSIARFEFYKGNVRHEMQVRPRLPGFPEDEHWE